LWQVDADIDIMNDCCSFYLKIFYLRGDEQILLILRIQILLIINLFLFYN